MNDIPRQAAIATLQHGLDVGDSLMQCDENGTGVSFSKQEVQLIIDALTQLPEREKDREAWQVVDMMIAGPWSCLIVKDKNGFHIKSAANCGPDAATARDAVLAARLEGE